MSDAGSSPKARGLRTLRDFLRFAVSRFNEADIAYGQGTTTAIDEAVFLILETLHLPIDQLDPFLDARLTGAERKRLAARIEARAGARRPAAYITGRAYIQGVPFAVDERVIVPRSFIGEILAGGGEGDAPMIDSLIDKPQTVKRVLDLCTGSASLAILAALRFPQAKVDATELSPEALEVARQNVDYHGLGERVSLFEGDLFAPVGRKRYDLILANPPYVDAAAMAALPPEFRHEPAMALDGGSDGLDIVRRILADAPARLTANGALLCEIGSGRALLEAERPDLTFLWLDTEESEGEVFWLPRSGFPNASAREGAA